MDKKTADKLVKSIEWSKSAQGGWTGTIYLKDGYCLSIVAHCSMKMREAKSMIKDKILERAPELAAERGTDLF